MARPLHAARLPCASGDNDARADDRRQPRTGIHLTPRSWVPTSASDTQLAGSGIAAPADGHPQVATIALAPHDRAKTRKPHSSPPVARGFLLWRISYTSRCPISFTHADVRTHPPASQHRTSVHHRPGRRPARCRRLDTLSFTTEAADVRAMADRRSRGFDGRWNIARRHPGRHQDEDTVTFLNEADRPEKRHSRGKRGFAVNEAGAVHSPPCNSPIRNGTVILPSPAR